MAQAQSELSIIMTRDFLIRDQAKVLPTTLMKNSGRRMLLYCNGYHWKYIMGSDSNQDLICHDTVNGGGDFSLKNLKVSKPFERAICTDT